MGKPVLNVKMLLSVSLIAVFAFQSSSTTISGDISSISFSSAQSPYLVDGDIFVPSGKKVVIPAGVAFLFKALSNLKLSVEGSLIVHGTEDAPVVFTSSNDPQFSPDSAASVYDWTGIQISGSAQQVMLRSSEIRYARNPVETRIPATRFENVKFSNNMYSQVIIDGKELDISQEQPFNYPLQKDTVTVNGTEAVPDSIPAAGKNISINTKTGAIDTLQRVGNSRRHEKTLRRTFLCACLVSAGAGAATLIGSYSHGKKRDGFESKAMDDNLTHGERRDAYDKAVDENKISTNLSRAGIVGCALTGIFAVGFVFTFVF